MVLRTWRSFRAFTSRRSSGTSTPCGVRRQTSAVTRSPFARQIERDRPGRNLKWLRCKGERDLEHGRGYTRALGAASGCENACAGDRGAREARDRASGFSPFEQARSKEAPKGCFAFCRGSRTGATIERILRRTSKRGMRRPLKDRRQGRRPPR